MNVMWSSRNAFPQTRWGRAGAFVALAGLTFGCAAGPDGSDRAPSPPESMVVTSFGGLVIERYVDGRAVSHRVAVPADMLWPALILAYEDLGLEVGTLESGTRTIGNLRLAARRTLADEPLARFFDCGATGVGAPMANTHRLEIRVLTRVVGEGEDRSRLETDLSALAYPVGTSTRPSECHTRGQLEDRILRTTLHRVATR
jgi:hypothetical protein